MLNLSFLSVSTISHYSLEKFKKNLGMKILKIHIYATIEKNKGQKSPTIRARRPLYLRNHDIGILLLYHTLILT